MVIPNQKQVQSFQKPSANKQNSEILADFHPRDIKINDKWSFKPSGHINLHDLHDWSAGIKISYHF